MTHMVMVHNERKSDVKILYWINLVSCLFGWIPVTGNSVVFAADMTIDMLNKDANGNKMVYSNEIAKVAVGDTITWLPASKGHNVEIIGYTTTHL